MIYGGIDPGNKGWFVAMDEHRQVVLQREMPLINVGKGKKNKWVLDMHGVLAILTEMKDIAVDRSIRGEMFVVLEKAQVMAPGAGGSSPASARSMFGYGRAFGALEMALIALKIPHEEVHPRTWGGKVLKGVEGADTKARAILKCRRALPHLDLTPGRKRVPQDGIADAGCMCLYAMMLHPVAGVQPVAVAQPPSATMPPLPPGPPDASSRKPPPPPPRKS